MDAALFILCMTALVTAADVAVQAFNSWRTERDHARRLRSYVRGGK